MPQCVNDSSGNPFKPARILAGLKDCNEWHDPQGNALVYFKLAVKLLRWISAFNTAISRLIMWVELLFSSALRIR